VRELFWAKHFEVEGTAMSKLVMTTTTATCGAKGQTSDDRDDLDKRA